VDPVARLAAELEIRNVVARLAQLADSGGTDEYLALLDAGAVWAMPANPGIGLEGSERRGRDAIAEGIRERKAAGVQGPGSNTMHAVSTISVTVDGPDSARAQSNFVFFTSTTTAPTIQSVGRYDDTFALAAGGWKLTRRTITFG